ncbi:MAG TPA: hypothetical protein EYQ14_25860 [Gammaproteobacteria bacterium]|nr:hypothetical protein [Gammaproteobacteria bacterium]
MNGPYKLTELKRTYTLQRKQQFRNTINPDAETERPPVIQEVMTENLDTIKDKFWDSWYGKELESEMSVYHNYEKILASALGRDWDRLRAGQIISTPPFKKNQSTETWTDYQLFEGYNTDE